MTHSSRRPFPFLPTVLLLLFLLPSQNASAQFLRLGPFDFDAKLTLKGVYTTNVDGVRPSDATAPMTDYYVSAGLDLNSIAEVAPSTTLHLDTGVAEEHHFKRPDLDNSSSPFGRARIDSKTEFGHYLLLGSAGYDKSSSSAEKSSSQDQTSGSASQSVFVPGNRKTRDVHSTKEYGLGLKWERDPFHVSENYDFSQERHDDPAFQDGDQDVTSWNFGAGWRVFSNLGLNYKNERTKTVLINDPTSFSGYRTTETITVDWTLKLIERPSVTYSFGFEKENTDTGNGKWDPIHNLKVSDSRDLSPTLHLNANADYKYDPAPNKQTDIAFTYAVILDHDISATAKEALSFERAPVSTFASTADTDETSYGYSFRKTDLFIYGLQTQFNVTYKIQKPLDGSSPTENTWNYAFFLEYGQSITRTLSRTLRYEYTRESSNLQSEDLEEHRVTLSYVYNL